METFIPIIIAIAVFAVQVYANYQKEQDKARKRVPGPPPLPEDNADHVKDIAKRMQPAVQGVYTRDLSPAVRPEFENYSGVMEPSPSGSKRDEPKRPLIPQRLAVDTEHDVLPALDAATFDLRDAVIKSIVLERPYK